MFWGICIMFVEVDKDLMKIRIVDEIQDREV